MNKYYFILCLLNIPLFMAGSGITDSVKMWKKPLVLPTYLTGEPEKAPLFMRNFAYQRAKGGIYPYALQANINDQKENREYTALYLENQYIKICVLPEMGGRLFYAPDKTNNYEISSGDEIRGVSCKNSCPVCPAGREWIFSRDFSDEFNGTGLDKNKWMDLVPSWYGRKPSLFSATNVKVADGMLQLVCDEQKPEEVTYENRIRGFDKFRIAISKSKNRIRYGYFEARCRSMKANVCNAFWLYDPLDPPAKYREGSFSEEIDIFEMIGKPSPEYRESKECIYSTTVHRFVTPYLEGVVNLNRPPLPRQGAKQRVPFRFYEDFHLYAFLWTPYEMKWFVDGKEVFSRDNDYFTRPLHIVFDCETLWGVPDPADLPATFEIDYLRVWQLPDPSRR